ncbi:MAG: pre-peptidase C-terminal domain-containing protein [Rhizobium sp.]|nr:pre-peptidase C-terminal domain-containing protein [Rhizobium sp.]
MNTQTAPQFRKRSLPTLAAFVATLLALPVSSVMAQSFPSYPLQTGAGDVEPNIMFLLDDSGSMAFTTMPNSDIPQICRRANNGNCQSDTITNSTYVGNTVYYNPAVDYEPWQNADGTRMTGGTTMTAVFGSFNFAGPGTGGEYDTLDLTNDGACENYDRNGSSTTVCGGIQTYYVPKNPAQTSTAYLQETTNYYRYQVRTVNGATRVVRSELVLGGGYGDFPPTTTNLITQSGIAISQGNSSYYTFTVPAGTTQLRVQTVGSDTDADIYVQYNDNGDWNTECEDESNDSNELCVINNPASGSWRVRVYAYRSFANLTLTVDVIGASGDYGCAPVASSSYGWGGCTLMTPVVGRTEAQELENYATWFSYHRSRMKTAKAGASEAFNELGDNVRVGYRTIWNRSNYNIPVTDGNNGVFEGSARTTWFSRLFGARGENSTPLRAALFDTGEYFSDSSTSGPYGPAAAADQLECRQNFAILTTDGYWNGNIGSRTIGDQDGVSGLSIVNPADGSDTVRYTRSHPYQDTGSTTNYSNTLADVAMKYWKTDLRTDQDNIMPTSANNPAFWQHMVTFGISIGLKGTVDQGSVAEILRDGRPRINGVAVNWPDPTNTEDAERIDDLLHAAVNGHGEFIAANNAESFSTALSGVLGIIQSRLASGSNVATNSTTFQSDTRMYQATYRTGVWTGDLVARDVTAAGGIAATEAWRVTSSIDSTYDNNQSGDDFHNRPVLTWSGSAGASFPTTAQATALARSTGSAIVTGANNANYIKGDQSLEMAGGGVLRNRTSVLGDIINSSPFYIRDSEHVFVGANDGMLHAVDALTGEVTFSYVPAGLDWNKLSTISDPAYTHGFFVDGPVAVSSYRLVSGVNYLVGTLGRGGKGAFALDVSDPGNMANADVLWDKTAASDADMGYVLGLPLIVKGNNDEILAVVPNGIDSTNGHAVLYIYDVTNGSQIAKIDTGVGGSNGLSSPRAADMNADGKADYIYAGDLRGNVWKFDVTSAVATDWAVGLGGSPLFTATDAVGNPQPITGGLALARESANPRIWVTFGTGRLISISDMASTAIQTWYGIIDNNSTTIAGRSDLTERQIAIVGTNAQGRSVRAFEAYAALPTGSRGWYVDLDEPTAGERVVSGARINGRAAFVSSVIPSEGNGCESGGSGYLNAIDVFTGTSPEGADGGGTSSSFFDTDGNGSGSNDTIGEGENALPIGSVDLGVGMPTESSQIDDLVLVCGSDGTCEEVPAAPQVGGPGSPRRMSWRELYGED